ncbi:MAG: indolepyruvate oxidoreductase subunit beta [Deltaproteobacteria bacterium]|nr:indolepyruvate oxidoreductase subunit beta [Deltaproteobacteria bacterium]
MEHNILLAGVGGQGILSIAQAISGAALRRGLEVRQAELHGMSQRGGVVQAHLRIADHVLHSDLIPAGRADLLISVEPLEALRYVHLLADGASLVSSVNAFVNLTGYPAVEGLLARLAAHPRHVLIDAERLARAAGSGRAANVVLLGAASLFVELAADELEAAVAGLFAEKGGALAEANRRAFRFGRHAARTYLDGVARGASSAAVRHFIETLSPEHLAAAERPDEPVFPVEPFEERLSGAEEHAVALSLKAALAEGRTQLFEHEVYTIVQLVGAIAPPEHLFVSHHELPTDEALAQLPGDQVVLKVVSPEVVHKSDAGGVVFVRKDGDVVRAALDRLFARHAEADVRGVLIVERVPQAAAGLGSELFVGLRATREFGPVLAAGLGGLDTEYLAQKMRPGLAVAKALASEVTAEEFLTLFQRTAAYELLAGRVRGHERLVGDGELVRCFRAFLLLARHFATARDEGPSLVELEVNPFAFRHARLVPLDGRGRLGTAARAKTPRPRQKLRALLEPGRVGVIGVSSSAASFGHIILSNVQRAGFPRERLTVIKPGVTELDGVACVPSLTALEEPVDLLVVAVGAEQLPAIAKEVVESGKVQSAILIPGGAGETKGSEALAEELRRIVASGRARPDGGPLFLGPNSLGVVSRPGRYDTFFVPESRMDKRFEARARPVALVSQSGAFIVSRLSNLETLDPAFAISIGNQLDLTPADLLSALAERSDVKVVAIYAEGFGDEEGLELVREIDAATRRGTQVLFYKAGRTAEGRSAAAGHTASVAGDYDVCTAAATEAGALVTDTFRELEQLLELCAFLCDKRPAGTALGAISNAGFEAVGIADALVGPRWQLTLPTLAAGTMEALRAALELHGLTRLVTPRNPLDLTPMATDAAYEAAARAFLADPGLDALVVGIVPLTATLKSVPGELASEESLARRLPALLAGSDKPLVAVVDAGPRYEPLVSALRAGGVPVCRSADQAIRSVGRYLTQHQTVWSRR